MEYRGVVPITAFPFFLGMLLLACSPNELVIPRDDTPPPPPLPLKNRIFFSSTLNSPNGSSQIFSMKPDGTDIMQVTSPDTNSRGWITTFVSVSISPDLDRLAFTWEWLNVFDDYYEMAITDTSLADIDQRVDWCYGQVVWSPGGKSVAYSQSLYDGMGGPQDIYIIPDGGGVPAKITRFGHNNPASDTGAVPMQWIADSTILAKVTVDTISIGFSHHICELGLDGSIKRWILSDSLNDYTGAALSPGGDKLAYVYHPKNALTSGIGVSDPDGGNAMAILPELDYGQGGNFYRTILWSPDGSRLAVSSYDWVITVNPDGTEVDSVLVASDSAWYGLCDWK